MINITLKDGSVINVEPNTSIADVAKGISMGLYRNCCSALVNGEVRDLRDELTGDCSLELLTFDSEEDRKSVV